MHVILDSSYGEYKVHIATVENAKIIFGWHLDMVPKDVIELANIIHDKKKYTAEHFVTVINSILRAPVGNTILSKTLTVTDELKNEVVLYCFNKKLTITKDAIDSYAFTKVFSLRDISCFRDTEIYPDDLLLVNEHTLKLARMYDVITNDRWKPIASDNAKISYILQFINGITNRETHYSIEKITALTE